MPPLRTVSTAASNTARRAILCTTPSMANSQGGRNRTPGDVLPDPCGLKKPLAPQTNSVSGFPLSTTKTFNIFNGLSPTFVKPACGTPRA